MNTNTTNTDKRYTLSHGGHTLSQPDPDKLNFTGTVPHSAFVMVLENMNTLALEKSKVMDNSDFTSDGKARKLAPLYSRTWDAVCFAHVTLAAYQAATAQRDAKLVALPALDNGATAVCLEDIEVRQWFRSLSMEERGNVMAAMQRDEAGGVRYARLQLAALRSPAPMLLEHEERFFRSEWIKTARLGNVGEAVAIDGQKAAAQWGARGISQLVGILHGLTEWTRSDLLAFLVSDAKRIGTAAALGFGSLDVASAQARHEAAKRTAAMA